MACRSPCSNRATAFSRRSFGFANLLIPLSMREDYATNPTICLEVMQNSIRVWFIRSAPGALASVCAGPNDHDLAGLASYQNGVHGFHEIALIFPRFLVEAVHCPAHVFLQPDDETTTAVFHGAFLSPRKKSRFGGARKYAV